MPSIKSENLAGDFWESLAAMLQGSLFFGTTTNRVHQGYCHAE